MSNEKYGPAGLVEWEQKFPELFSLHGGPVTLAAAVKEAPVVVQELVDLVERYPLEFWRGKDGAVLVRETNKQDAAEHMEVVNRCVAIMDEHQPELREWLGSLVR